jgi:uncharacterized spore protein YtfJ
MAGNDFKSTVDSLLQGMNQFVSSKTVVGDALHVGDTIIVPLVDVSFGVGAGATAGNSKNSNSGGGVGGKVSPTAVLVISNGTTKMVNVKSADSLTKILDMVPDFVNRFTNKGGASAAADDIKVEDLNIDGSK